MIVMSMIAIGIFSAYMLYDVKRIVDGGETNYISATLALRYLDIINVFQNLLALLESSAASATGSTGAKHAKRPVEGSFLPPSASETTAQSAKTAGRCAGGTLQPQHDRTDPIHRPPRSALTGCELVDRNNGRPQGQLSASLTPGHRQRLPPRPALHRGRYTFEPQSVQSRHL